MRKKLMLVVMVFVCIFTFADTKVLFDNGHAQTAGSAHWTISTGFSDFAYDIEKRLGYKVDDTRKDLTFDMMRNYDIVVIPEPNDPFSRDEIDALKEYVRNGGGLFLIADHEGADRNNNGWDAVRIYNKFTEEFGFKFDYKTFSEHPLKGDRVDCQAMEGVTDVGTWGGTSITITDSKKAQGLIEVGRTGNPFLVVASYGKGRVAAAGDSSPFDDGTMSHKKDIRGSLHDNYNMRDYDHPVMATNLVKFLAKEIGDDLDIIRK